MNYDSGLGSLCPVEMDAWADIMSNLYISSSLGHESWSLYVEPIPILAKQDGEFNSRDGEKK